MEAAASPHTAFWPTFHAVLASAPASVSTTCMKVSGWASPPPSERGRKSRNSSASCSPSMTGSGIRRSRSISSAAAAMRGTSRCARSR